MQELEDTWLSKLCWLIPLVQATNSCCSQCNIVRVSCHLYFSCVVYFVVVHSELGIIHRLLSGATDHSHWPWLLAKDHWLCHSYRPGPQPRTMSTRPWPLTMATDHDHSHWPRPLTAATNNTHMHLLFGSLPYTRLQFQLTEHVDKGCQTSVRVTRCWLLAILTIFCGDTRWPWLTWVSVSWSGRNGYYIHLTPETDLSRRK